MEGLSCVRVRGKVFLVVSFFICLGIEFRGLWVSDTKTLWKEVDGVR